MSSATGLLPLLAGIVLLVWSIRFIRDQVMSAFGDRMRSSLRRFGKSMLLASLGGTVMAAALQSGAAASLIVTAFAERAFLSDAAAIAAVFGADLGSALMVQLLSMRMAAFAPVLIIVGGALALGIAREGAKPYGTILFGFGLVLSALAMVSSALSGLSSDPLFVAALEKLGSQPLLGIGIAAVLTLVLHSSIAMVLPLAALAQTGALSLESCLYLVLGANIGSSIIPMVLSRHTASTTRILVANMTGRVIMAGVFASVPFVMPQLLQFWDGAQARFVIEVHLLFNAALALLGVPLARPLSIVLKRIWPDDANDDRRIRVQHLDEKALELPALALACAARETLRVADRVERMLDAAMRYFKAHDRQSEKELRTLDDEIDFLQEEIKLYLARLGGHHLEEKDRVHAFELILFTTNLEHAGDIIEKSLVPLAKKQARLGARFSDEGWREIKQMHAAVSAQMQYAMLLFFSPDLEKARRLVAAKDEIRERERLAMRSHLERLERGTPETIATSALHLDIMRDLKRISAHLKAIAYPVLERSGEILSTRLRVAQ